MDRRLIGLLIGSAVLAVIVVVVLVGRGGGGSDATSSVADVGTKPTVDVPKGSPPQTLQVTDLEPGEGDGAKAGDQLSVKYVGVLYDTGKEFDSNWDTGQPFDFQLGGGQVIPGWDQGLEGMKAGGVRRLVIPPELGYGAQGRPPTIPPSSTLVFVVGLVSIR
jgi:peptidylprolyl isomerase